MSCIQGLPSYYNATNNGSHKVAAAEARLSGSKLRDTPAEPEMDRASTESFLLATLGYVLSERLQCSHIIGMISAN
jgi:hypothetical protein